MVGTPDTIEVDRPSDPAEVEFQPALPIGVNDERVCVTTLDRVVVKKRVVVSVVVSSLLGALYMTELYAGGETVTVSIVDVAGNAEDAET